MSALSSPSDKAKTAKMRRQRFIHFEFERGDEELISSLTERHQSILKADGSYKERAEQLGLPLGTLRSRLHRARAALVELRRSKAEMKSIEPLNPVRS